MKLYKRRPGVVLTEVAGEHLLVAAAGLEGVCPYVTQISDSAALYWELLGETDSFPALQELAAARLGKEPKELLLPLIVFFKRMQDSGYLLTEDDA